MSIDAKTFIEALSDSGRFSTVVTKKARVISIEGTTAWVSVIGGAPRTPCTMGVSCKPNDYVMVTFADNRAIVTSNVTAPATDDTEANSAHELADVAVTEAGRAYSYAQIADDAAKHAEESAIEAAGLADAAQGSANSAQSAADAAQGAADTANGILDDMNTAAEAAGRTLTDIYQYSVDAKSAADTANGILDDMEDAAQAAGTTLTRIYQDAADAETHAQEAKTSAAQARTSAVQANEYASRALGHLGTVESVSETLTWITEHGTMELTADTEPDPTHVYFVANENGAYTVGGSKYDIVVEPDPNDMASYYELTIDESLQNYVGTHMALTDEGLWLIPEDGTGYRILVSTGGGSYDAGTHIIDSGGDSVAKLGDEIVLGRPEDSQVVIDSDSMEIDDYGSAYFFVGRKASDESYARHTDTFVGDGSSQTFYLSVSGVTVESLTVDGADTPFEVGMVLPSGRRYVKLETPPASGAVIKVVSYDNSPNLTFGKRATGSQVGEYSVSEGWGNEASGRYSHAEGYTTKASGDYSKAGGRETKASDFASEASGYKTISSGRYQKVFGRANVESGKYVEIVGNGAEYDGIQTHLVEEYFDEWETNLSFVLRQTPASIEEIRLVDGFGDSSSYIDGGYTFSLSGRTVVLDTDPDEAISYGTCESITIVYSLPSARSNARTLDLDGNEQLAGGIYVGATNANNTFTESDKGIGSDGVANLSGVKIDGNQVVPTFERASWDSSSDESTLPTTPCYVLNTTDNSFWYCSGDGITLVTHIACSNSGNRTMETANAANLPLLTLDADGECEQDSTTGKNLLELNGTSGTANGITVTMNADGSVKVSGTATATFTRRIRTTEFTVSPGAYTLSGGTSDVRLIANYTKGSYTDRGHGVVLTVDEGDAFNYVYVSVSNGATVDAVLYPQLELGSTATDYEPYTGGAPSPSPDYPQEIRVARGRNLFNGSYKYHSSEGTTKVNPGETYTISSKHVANQEALNYAFLYSDGTYGNDAIVVGVSLTYNAVTVTVPDNVVGINLYANTTSTNTGGYIYDTQIELGSTLTPYVPYGYMGLEVHGKNLLPSDKHLLGNEIIFGAANHTTPSAHLEAGTYTMSGEEASGGKWVNLYVRDIKASSGGIVAGGATLPYTFTVNTDCDVSIWVYKNTYTSVDAISWLQLERGTEATDYEPYHHTVTPIPCELRSLPDGTHDTLSVDGAGHVVVERKTGKVVLDGSETWNLSGNGKRVEHPQNDCAKASSSDSLANVYCSHFIAGTANTTYDGTQGIANSKNSGHIMISDGTDSMTVSSWQTWLTTHNVEVVYPLATPTTEDLGYISMPEVFDGATVKILAEIQPLIDGSWWTVAGSDVGKAHEAQQERIETLPTGVKGNAESTYRTGNVNLTPANIGAAPSNHNHSNLMNSDTRNDNQTPQWYFTNYPRRAVFEFKSRSAIGAPGTSSFVNLLTLNAWNDSSGGYPVQIAIDSVGNFSWRYGTGQTTWSSWASVSKDDHTHPYLPLSGGTLTGIVSLKSTGINRDAANPSADQWGTPLILSDADNERIGIIEPCRHSDGSISCYFRSYAENTSGTQYENVLELRTYRDGSRSVGVSDGAIWRSAIGAAATNHTHSYATTSDFPRIVAGNEIRFDASTMPANPIEIYIGWAWSDGTKAARINGYRFHDGNGVMAPIYASNIIDSDGYDKISKILHASDYMHVETANYGNFGVSWWSSDIRMKSNIEDSDVDALELVNAIEHRSFDMNGEHYPIGYIAQELEELDPQLVIKVPQSREVNGVSYFTGDYRYQIDPNKVIPYLSKSIQQLSQENDELKAKNAELESRLEAIERKLGL